MTQVADEKNAKKEAMKGLRESRRHAIKAISARVKEQKKTVKAIREQIEDGARTVPEIAEATGISTSEVLWFVATLKKYGTIIEAEKDGGYFRYCLANNPQEGTSE